MRHPSGCQITYNGEIYNFPVLKRELERDGEFFHGNSDTEVLLAGVYRWGAQFIRRLEGMYAFAVYDPRGPSLLLARDPAGIKPLYTAHTPHGFVFASEVRAVLATGMVSRTVSHAAIAGFLAYGSVQQPLTLYEQVRMFPAGAYRYVRVRETGLVALAPVTWWQPPSPVPMRRDHGMPEVVQATRQMLDTAVKDHLVSDVPVGLFLSAGIDSSAVAGLAAAHSPDVQTFTVGFSGHPELNELGIASETASRLGLKHTGIPIECEQAEGLVGEWLAAADQPSMDGLNIFVIARAVREHGIKVALCGLGADELFGGYSSFRDVPRLRAVTRAVQWIPRRLRGGLAQTVSVFRPQTVRDKLTDIFRGPGTAASLTLQRRRVLSNRLLHTLGLNAANLGLDHDWLPPDRLPADPDLGWVVSAVESRYYQGNMLLRDADANGMAHGLEIRVPYLDQRLVSYLNQLPGEVRLPPGRPAKWLLKQAVADLLHEDLLARPKTGFHLPLSTWMRGPLRSVCEQGLAALRETEVLNPTGVSSVWKLFLHESESQPWAWTRAFTLVALGDYLRRTKSVSYASPAIPVVV
jgi:asparagine synthase (glutamine-hydrolysing)